MGSVYNGMLKPYAHRFSNVTQRISPTWYYPNQLASIYKFPADYNGAGQKVAFIELGGGFVQNDLNTYFSALSLSSPTVHFVSVDGGINQPTNVDSADGEVMLDLCVAIGAANGINPYVYMAPNSFQGFIDAVNRAITDGMNIISISWGAPEDQWTSSALGRMNQALQRAANASITVTVASGDSGSSDGERGNHVDFPSSSPYVLACGGTSLATSNSNIISETVWNDVYGATGGGFSASFAKPVYQSSTFPNTTRGVPDVAAVADPVTGVKVIVDGQYYVFGGTSAVAPLMAALIARLNQALGRSLGYVNSKLYRLPSAFRDITSGKNGFYSAKTGWDACTGLGSPNGQKLLTGLQSL